MAILQVLPQDMENARLQAPGGARLDPQRAGDGIAPPKAESGHVFAEQVRVG